MAELVVEQKVRMRRSQNLSIFSAKDWNTASSTTRTAQSVYAARARRNRRPLGAHHRGTGRDGMERHEVYAGTMDV